MTLRPPQVVVDMPPPEFSNLLDTKEDENRDQAAQQSGGNC